MRIALIQQSLERKGPAIFTQYYISELKKRVEYVEVFYFFEKGDLDFGVKCTKISRFTKQNFSNFDVVHTTMARPDLYAALFCDKKRWITSMHAFMYEDINNSRILPRAKIIIALWKAALSKTNHIIVSSEEMRRYYKRLFGDKDYEVIPYGIPYKEYGFFDEPDAVREFRKHNYVVTCSVGTLIERKGFKQIIDLLSIEKEMAAVIVGDGPDKDKLLAYAIKKGVENRICFLGFIKDSYNIYKYIDIYMHVSYSEGYGLSFLEALSHGKATVCSNLKIYSDLVSENDVGFFEPDDITSLQMAYVKVKENMSYYSKKAYNLFKEHFSLNLMVDRHVEFYKKVIHNAISLN